MLIGNVTLCRYVHEYAIQNYILVICAFVHLHVQYTGLGAHASMYMCSRCAQLIWAVS